MQLKYITVVALLSAAQAAEHHFFIGTRTDRESKGIYRAVFDDSTGVVSRLNLAATYKDPGFLCLHPKKNLLYSIGNRPDGTGALATFSVGKDRSLTFVADVASGGQGPCHLAVNPEATAIAVANYGSGHTTSFLLDAKGYPSAVVSSLRMAGKSVHPQRQTSAHAHGVYFADGHCFVPDLGVDQILTMEHDAKTAALRMAQPASIATAPGAGPRHLAFHLSKPWVYCVNELTNTVTHYERDKNVLTAKETITTLPAEFHGVNTTAEIEVHPNGRFLYASNRGHNSIASFVIDSTSGALTATGQTLTNVKIPRHFVIAPGGAFMIVAGQDSDNLHVLAIDPQSGKLTATDHTFACPSPICLLFCRE